MPFFSSTSTTGLAAVGQAEPHLLGALGHPGEDHDLAATDLVGRGPELPFDEEVALGGAHVAADHELDALVAVVVVDLHLPSLAAGDLGRLVRIGPQHQADRAAG